MNLGEFDLAALPRGGKHKLSLDISDQISLPLLIVRGRREGRVLTVSAGVHGDEHEGMRAIFESFDELDPDLMSGDFLAVPVANPPGFWSGTSISPVDGENLARIFPGNPVGTLSHRIAYHLGRAIISQADLYLDLHSGGTKYRMPSMVGYCLTDPRGKAAAEAFGSPVIWGHPSVSPGRTVSFAHERGIPWLYTEARGAGRIHPDDLRMMTTGIRNLLRHLAILPGRPDSAPAVRRLCGAGDTDKGIITTQAGFLLNQVGILDTVSPGQLLSRLVGLHGEPLQEFRAPGHGVVGMIREFPVVQAGDPLFLFAEEESGGSKPG